MAVNSIPSQSVSQGLSAVVQDIQKERLAQARQQQPADAGSGRDGAKALSIEKSDARAQSFAQQVQAQEVKRSDKTLEIKATEERATTKRSIDISQAFSREAPIGGGRNQRPGSLLDISV